MFKSLIPWWRKSKGSRTPAAEKRNAPRHRAQRTIRLLFSLSVIDANLSAGQHRPLTLIGHTRDVSASGLGLVVPSLKINGKDLIHGGRALLIELELPSGPIKLQGVPVRHKQLDEQEEEGEIGYLLGVRITQLSKHAQAELDKYLRTLRR